MVSIPIQIKTTETQAPATPKTPDTIHTEEEYNIFNVLSTSLPKCEYYLVFAAATDKTIRDAEVKAKKSDREKYQIMDVFAIAATIYDVKTREDIGTYLFIPPDLDQHVTASNGWIDEFSDLMDGATFIVTFNSPFQYGCLRKHMPFEQRMIFWQFVTFDFYSIIKKETYQWIGLFDLIRRNSLETICRPDVVAPTREFAQGKVKEAIVELFDQVVACWALFGVLSNEKTQILYTHKEKKEISPGSKGDVYSVREIDVAKYYTKLFAEKHAV